jgi:hypothetical protein
MRHVQIGDAVLEVSDEITGEPIVFIQTALTADELLPLTRDDPALRRCAATATAGRS